MPKLEIMGFDGIVPRQSATMLADTQAQQAHNVKLYARELRYWRGPKSTYVSLTANTSTIYKLYGPAADSRWLTWAFSADVSTGPLADTTDYRVYYSRGLTGVPRKTNWALASTGPGPYPASSLDMGVPAPTAAPTLALSAGASVGSETRAYVYTFVSTFGSLKEESAPSPAAQITVTATKQVDLSALQTSGSGVLNLTHKRIYRSVTGGSTDSYQFVMEIPIAQTTATDNLLVAALGEELATIGWSTPPADLTGLCAHPSGSLVGFSGNTVYFSEPNFAHAWPSAYALSIPYNIIGLGTFGQSVVVCTDRYPYIITGPFPGAMSMERLPLLEPCVAKTTIVSDESGVVYASPDGLVTIGANIIDVTTKSLFRRDEWQAKVPTLIKAGTYDGKYFACYTDISTPAMLISRDDIPALSTLELSANCIYVDSRDAKFYYLNSNDNTIYELDADEVNPFTYEWKSKRFLLPQATSFSALRLDADFSQITADAAYDAEVAAINAANAVIFAAGLNGAVNTRPLNFGTFNGSDLVLPPTVSGNRYAQVHIYGDGVLQAVLSMGSISPIRIPAFKCRDLEVKIIGTINVRSVTLATTVQELYA